MGPTVCFKTIDACPRGLPSHVFLHWSSAIEILFERVYEPVRVWKPLGRDIDPRCAALCMANKRRLNTQSQQSVGDPNIPPPHISLPLVTNEDSITTLETDVEEVRSLLASWDTSKSPRADGVPSKVLKFATSELAPSLARIFNQSLSTGNIPSEWKQATITPLHKKASHAGRSIQLPTHLLAECYVKAAWTNST